MDFVTQEQGWSIDYHQVSVENRYLLGIKNIGHYLAIQNMNYHFNSRTEAIWQFDFRTNMKNLNDQLLGIHTELQFKASKKLTLKTRLRFDYDSTPAWDRYRKDISLMLVISYGL